MDPKDNRGIGIVFLRSISSNHGPGYCPWDDASSKSNESSEFMIISGSTKLSRVLEVRICHLPDFWGAIILMDRLIFSCSALFIGNDIFVSLDLVVVSGKDPLHIGVNSHRSQLLQ